ncbi:MAG: hypothetical protein HC862_12035 [Scytonema sp. RU_4_4]|nr:hypothetical protein [Scytonema sp. RU_4_4]
MKKLSPSGDVLRTRCANGSSSWGKPPLSDCLTAMYENLAFPYTPTPTGKSKIKNQKSKIKNTVTFERPMADATPYGYRGRPPVSLRVPPVAYGGASAVLGSQCVAEVPSVVAPGVSPQVEHLALETLLQRWSHQVLPLREAATRLQVGKPGRQNKREGNKDCSTGSPTHWLLLT